MAKTGTTRKPRSPIKKRLRGTSRDGIKAKVRIRGAKAAKPRPGRPDSGRAPRSGSQNAPKTIRTYRAAVEYLDSQVNYERRPPRINVRGALTLSRMQRLLADLGNPHKAFRSVHIAGTKGKGSTATMLSEMLRSNGLKVGLYTSPHIIDLRERITVNGQMIAEAAMTRGIAHVAQVSAKYKDEERPTFFEVLTAVAFVHFKAQGVEMAVVETGLGGRYDATNVLLPEACGVTSISYDHMAQLGNTLTAIAEEKAGIFKENVPVVSAPQPVEVKKALRRVAKEAKAPILFTGEEIGFSYRFESSRISGPQARIGITTQTSHFDHLIVPLVGEHQAVNCGVALGLLDQLKGRGFRIDDEAAIAGLAKVRLEGRMEMVCDKPRVLVDCAHNAASIEALMRAIGQNVPYDSMVVIFGCCADKDVSGMLKHLQLGADKIIFTGIKSPRTADPVELARDFSEVSGRMVQVAPNLTEAMEIAQKAITREDLICITGSFYLVSEAKRLFKSHRNRARAAGAPVP